MTRVHAPRRKLNSNAPLGLRVCQWCGEDYPVRDGAQAFCCTAHRTEFNNLRKERGALLYDLFMACRYERDLAKKLGLFAKLYTFASNFRREDKEARAGRKSWRDPTHVIERRPDLLAKVIFSRKRKDQE